MTTDAYTWLNADTEEVQAWQEQQVSKAMGAVRDFPGFAELVEEIAPLMAGQLAGALAERRKVAGRWFWLDRNEEGTAQAIRVAEDRDAPGQVLVDAAALTAERGDDRATTLIYPEPSPDGRLLAFSAAAGGDPFGQFLVVEVDSGARLPVAVPAMQGNLIRPAWLPDSTGFFLAGRGETGEHTLRFVPVTGGQEATWAVPGIPPTSLAVVPQVSPGGGRVLVVTAPHEHLATMIADTGTGEFRRFAPEDFHGELYGDWLDEQTYLAISTDTPRGRVVRIPVATSTDPATWQELIPASDLVLRSLYRLGEHLVVTALNDVSLDIRSYTLDGAPVATAALPLASASMQLTILSRLPSGTEAFAFSASSFTTADTTYELHPETGALDVLAPGASLDDITVEQHFATSADGTRVPYYLLARTDLDRTEAQPTLVSAYGGFNIPKLPTFLGALTPWLRSGGIYVHANLRGGSEYGREWYESARRQHKQNTFDDLHAVAEDLVRRNIATPETLAFQGSSNGGLLAGVAVTQQPELWRAVVPTMPVLDVLTPVPDGPGAEMIRSVYELDYGNPAAPADAEVMARYSPCQNIRPGVRYPAVFVVVGNSDIGCPPQQARRFVAALREASSSAHPVLLRVWTAVGHGSLDPRIAAELQAEWLAFVMRELGVELVPRG
ncbi:prolyl oligopeptidase family serine peptidase [Crossiella sp. SN42]|uniref:prolyl oligopeptidase family serine peptidase n=1 Tax=Crossiella sp. SN42 TaxID=2944808 RepID=UPI00207C1FF2|nr:prolyl oligopeptidase family serine peptidase [Crossiella sp. SN42]MCO1575978.1 prolyl oligopeptidase family serine peptidase [Crossiella sp. SN42]